MLTDISPEFADVLRDHAARIEESHPISAYACLLLVNGQELLAGEVDGLRRHVEYLKGLPGRNSTEVVVALERALSGMPEGESMVARSTVGRQEVIVLALCESERLVLRPDQLYRFTVMPGCARCAELASSYSSQTNREEKIDT